MAAQSFTETVSKSNFYFAIDENKKDTNIAVINLMAPGNKHRHPSIGMPHGKVHIKKYIDTSELTEEKLVEFYAYYSHLIDLHISQIRPQNLKDKSYIPPQFNQIKRISDQAQHEHVTNLFFDFYHRWREPTSTWRSQTQDIDHEQVLKNRPIAHHYDHDKGSKYDVEWTDAQKHPHVANRLGYPILMEDPVERVCGIERAPAHPNYQFQAFVQTPSMDPDPTVSFEQGEVVYENKRVAEWIKMWKILIGGLTLSWPAFYTFEIYQADGFPSLRWI